ncbi:hypothetical protein [Butyrivibrio sp. AE3006]|uniref:hypothetical protein n=1 Tax=Butyrivibrio sp. AE3006 TaxID=1280673 RepID=UPI0004221465|nr:hypothetical protein [Butyrivibrio sp. AE3006]
MNIKKAARVFKRAAVAACLSCAIFFFAPVMPASTVHAESCEHEDYEWVDLIKPTCSKEGKRIRICQDCEKVLETENIEKKEHKCKWEKTKDATCSAEGIKSYVCKNCNAVVDTEEIARKNHSFLWTTTRESTCAEEGLKQQICKNCGAIGESKAIQAKKHKYGEWSIGSVSVKGRVLTLTQLRTCKVCGVHKQTVTGKTAPFSKKHDKKKYYYKYTPKTGRVVILCPECRQSVTGKISSGALKFTKPKKDKTRTISKSWKRLKIEG